MDLYITFLIHLSKGALSFMIYLNGAVTYGQIFELMTRSLFVLSSEPLAGVALTDRL